MKQTAAGWIAIVGIAVIVAAMVVGPWFSPPVFSWVLHSTSEQAAQHSPGAWIMRVGFVAYGLGTAIAGVVDRGVRPFVRGALVVFGLGMVSTAIWSNAPIVAGMPADMTEDFLHSIASGVVGTAFAAACAARLFAPGGSKWDWLAWTGLVAAVVLPMAMGWWPDIRGLLQRTMFAISFVFVGREFLENGTARSG